MPVKLSLMIAGTYPMRDYVWMAKAAEDYGLDELHVADDLIMRPAWPILTLIGEHTARIRVGPAIVTPVIAHPAYHASNLVVLDELTGGRAVCGIGRGGLNPLIGITRPRQTGKMLREAVAIMRRMIARDATPYSGEFFHAAAELRFHHEPVRREIPLFIGTWGPKIAQLGGEIAIGIKADCVADPVYLGELRANVHTGARAAGRDPAASEIIVGPLCSISRDREAALRTIRHLLAIYLPFLSPMKERIGIDEAQVRRANQAYLAGDYAQAERLVPEAAIRAFSLTGTPREVIPHIENLVAAGATHVAFGPPHGPDFRETIRLIGEEIVPHFRA
jgi:5,10-methylenetetrahydromethanopterin reductase